MGEVGLGRNGPPAGDLEVRQRVDAGVVETRRPAATAPPPAHGARERGRSSSSAECIRGRVGQPGGPAREAWGCQFAFGTTGRRSCSPMPRIGGCRRLSATARCHSHMPPSTHADRTIPGDGDLVAPQADARARQLALLIRGVAIAGALVGGLEALFGLAYGEVARSCPRAGRRRLRGLAREPLDAVRRPAQPRRSAGSPPSPSSSLRWPPSSSPRSPSRWRSPRSSRSSSSCRSSAAGRSAAFSSSAASSDSGRSSPASSCRAGIACRRLSAAPSRP